MHMHYFTLEQREGLPAQVRAGAAALRASGQPKAIGLANHLAEIDDDAVADLEASLDVAALEREVRELREAEAALRSPHTPAYGICADCGAEIPFARLHASPTATQCVACQARIERVQAASRTL